MKPVPRAVRPIHVDALLAEVEREEPLSEGSEYVLKTDLIARASTGICEAPRNPPKVADNSFAHADH